MTNLLPAALRVVSAARQEVATGDHLICQSHPCGLCAELAAFDRASAETPVDPDSIHDYVAADDVCPSTGGSHVPGRDGCCIRCEEVVAA